MSDNGNTNESNEGAYSGEVDRWFRAMPITQTGDADH